MDNVTLNGGKPWTLTAVSKLRELWNEAVPPAVIAHTLGRPESEVRAKAGELKLPQHVDAVAG
ncbi:MAG TPA: hypothetical protein VFB16_12995 [Bauldia sp.]|nr:hypothetical protein [Bauldia sp.]